MLTVGLGRRSRRFPRGLVRVLHCQCIAHARSVARRNGHAEELSRCSRDGISVYSVRLRSARRYAALPNGQLIR
jgi:hypothetical protein